MNWTLTLPFVALAGGFLHAYIPLARRKRVGRETAARRLATFLEAQKGKDVWFWR